MTSHHTDLSKASSAGNKPAELVDPQQLREIQEGYLDRQRPIVIIGPMAAGKSYVGTHLARFYGYEFIDSDYLIVERYGPVTDIFEVHGEEYFRKLEAEVISEVLNSPHHRNTVLSLGGGAPMTAEVAEMLKNETVVYIKVDVDTVKPRIVGNSKRPLLQPNPIEKWSQIFESRREQYEQLAKYTLDARGHRNITEMTSQIQQFVVDSRKAN